MGESPRTGRVRRRNSMVLTGARRAYAVRLPGVLIVLLGFTTIVTAGVAQASQPPMAARSAWKVEPTPNQNKTSASINELSAISCTSGRACTAVGSHGLSLSSPSFTLAERWNGTRWRIQPTVRPAGAQSTHFNGVSCASTTACTAVGSYNKSAHRTVNLAEAWDGTNWRVQAIPTPKNSTGGDLTAVSCTSPSACTAVGHYSTATGRELALAERWNGTTWRIQALRRPTKITEFSGVSCEARRACTAVGFRSGTGGTQPFAEAWNGARWHVQAVPLPHAATGAILAAVSCTSLAACTATGTSFGADPTLAERWNGVRWRVQPTPNPVNFRSSMVEVTLAGVSCASAKACTAIGQYAPAGSPAYFLETWKGRRWRLVTAPNPAGFVTGTLNGISCVPARCAAVGYWSGGPISIATLAMAN